MNVTVRYPPEWTVKAAAAPQKGFFLFSPRKTPTDRYRENVNLSVDKALFRDLKTCVMHSLEKTDVVVSNMHIIAKENVRFRQFQAMKISFTGNKGSIYLSFVRYYFLHRGELYTLSFVAESARQKEYLPTAQKIFGSLDIR